MGPLPSRWWAVLLAVAVAVPAIVIAQEPEPEYLPVNEVECWRCHYQTAMKEFPQLKNFFAIIPPESAGSAPNTPFDYTVQIQNTWGADLQFIRPTMDLTGAPSISFVSALPDLLNVTEGAIAVNPTAPTTPQLEDNNVTMPFGYSKGSVVVTPRDRSPATGPALSLKIWGGSASGSPAVNASAGRGEQVFYNLTSRADFDKIGYGNWTVRVETTLVPPGSTDLQNVTLPPSSGQVAYELAVSAQAEAILDRQLSLPLRQVTLAGQARSVQFSLVALSEPTPGETVRLWVDGWVHYNHEASVNPDHANTTREFLPAIAVGPGGVLTAEIDPATSVFIPGVQNGPTMATISEAIGYAAAMLLVSSVWTGGMFGKGSRRQLNTVFGSAKRRVAFHNFLSYGILLASAVHTVLFIIEAAYYWTVGLIWGGISLLAMIGLGLTGAFQVQMIRRWSYGVWRWSHYALAVAAILFAVVHGLLDGVHFDAIQNRVGWTDPLDPRGVTV